MQGKKICKDCKQVLSLDQFYRHPNGVLGRQSYCIPCMSARSRTNFYRRTYGITPAEYDRMSEAQGGKCRICGLECSTGRRLAVDHCHATGRVRALLCMLCNRALGLLKDDPNLMRIAAAYVEEMSDINPREEPHV